jgi:hypothetical protein
MRHRSSFAWFLGASLHCFASLAPQQSGAAKPLTLAKQTLRFFAKRRHGKARMDRVAFLKKTLFFFRRGGF